MVRAKVVLKDVGGGENGANVQVALKYSPAHPKSKL